MRKILLSLLMLSCFSYIWSQPFPFEPDSNTVGLWHLNEGTGDIAYDTSGNNLHGDLENGVTWDSLGMFGNCLKFSANYHRIHVLDNSLLDITTDLTLDAWVKLDTSNNGSVIISKYNTGSATPAGQYCFGISNNNKLYCYLCDDTSQFYINSDSIFVEFNNWTLVSAVFSNSRVGLFINGMQVASSFVPFDSLTALEYPHDDLFIGDLWTDLYYPYSFDGKIDEVRISNIPRYEIIIADVENNDINTDPFTFILGQNYPNPFNPSTTLRWQMPVTGFVTLKIYDVLGREVATLVNEELTAGTHETILDASSFSSGVYFYQLRANHYAKTKKMILIK